MTGTSTNPGPTGTSSGRCGDDADLVSKVRGVLPRREPQIWPLEIVWPPFIMCASGCSAARIGYGHQPGGRLLASQQGPALDVRVCVIWISIQRAGGTMNPSMHRDRPFQFLETKSWGRYRQSSAIQVLVVDGSFGCPVRCFGTWTSHAQRGGIEIFNSAELDLSGSVIGLGRRS